MAGCEATDPVTIDSRVPGSAAGKLDACSLLDQGTAAAALGVGSVRPSDKSMVLDSPLSNVLACEYSPGAAGTTVNTPGLDGSALRFSTQREPNQAKAAAPSPRCGSSARPPSRPSVQPVASLQSVMSKLKETLKTLSFEPK